jgi:transcriptional regulator with XRE-family HTH domain
MKRRTYYLLAGDRRVNGEMAIALMKGGVVPASLPVDQVGEELRKRRQAAGWSLKIMEEKTGISAATLSRLERGSTPDVPTMDKAAKWLGVVIQTAGESLAEVNTDEDLLQTIEVHLRANKKLSTRLAKSIAESFATVMELEIAKEKRKRR